MKEETKSKLKEVGVISIAAISTILFLGYFFFCGFVVGQTNPPK